MKCGHCGDSIFVFEFWMKAADGRTIHSFITERGQLVCAPYEKLESGFGEVVEFPNRDEKSVAV
jgi:hypothetical protein